MKSFKINYTKPLEAPIFKDIEYGKLIIEIDGKPDVEIPLFAENSVSKLNPLFRVFSALKYLIFGTSLDEKK